MKPLAQITLQEKIQCLKEALHYWSCRQSLSVSDRIAAAESLGEWGLFDVPSIAKIVDLEPEFVAEFVKQRRGKTLDLNPEHLFDLQGLAVDRWLGNAIAWDAVSRMIYEGTSAGAIQRFTGINQGWISRKLRNMQGVPWDFMDEARPYGIPHPRQSKPLPKPSTLTRKDAIHAVRNGFVRFEPSGSKRWLSRGNYPGEEMESAFWEMLKKNKIRISEDNAVVEFISEHQEA